MKTSLVTGLDAQRSSEIKSEYQGSPMLRRRLIELLLKKQDQALKKRRGEDIYNSPNFGLIQADQIGYERAISEIIALIE